MNHSFFEDWLFARDEGEILTPEQEATLQEHMQVCESCQQLAASWRAVDAGLRRVPLAAPEPGFTTRWQARLLVEQKRSHRRQSLALLGFSVAGAGLLFITLLSLAWPWLQSPGVLWWAWLYRLLTVITYAQTVQDFLATLFRATSGAIPLYWWVFLAGLLTELVVLWVVSYRWLLNPRRVTR